MHRDVEAAKNEFLHFGTVPLSATSFIRQTIKNMDSAVKGHRVREACAAGKILTTTILYTSDQRLRNEFIRLVDPATGRIPTSIIYGTAHRDSLLATLSRSLGIVSPKIVELNTLAQHEYIPATQERYTSTRNERLARFVFEMVLSRAAIAIGETAQYEAIQLSIQKPFGRFNTQNIQNGEELLSLLNDAVFILMGLSTWFSLSKDEQQILKNTVDSFVRSYARG